MREAEAVRRLTASVALSALVHVAALAALWRPAPPPATKPVAIPVALVGRPGGGGGGSGEAAPAPRLDVPPAAAAPAPPPPPARRPEPASRPSAVARVSRTIAPPTAPPAISDAPGAAAAVGAPGDGGAGEGGRGGGGGGDGSGGARVAYGANPLPPYPLVARRLGREGVVLLEVVVAPDGSPTDVRVAQTSGFPPLDQSALTTVRSRWRFIPARRDGVPVESRVTVPIRFRLDRAGAG